MACATSLAAAQTPSPARLLVLLRNASALAIVDPESGNVLGRVPTVKDPHEVTTDGKLAYVGSQIEGIAVIDIAAQKEVRRLSPGLTSLSHDVLYSNGKLYFTAEGYKSLGRYDLATNTIDWTLGTGQNGPHMLILSRDMNTLYMSNPASASVSFAEGILAGPPKWQVTSVSVPGPGPEGIALSPDGRELWVASRGDGAVSIIDVASKKVTETL
ncbi:MAG: YncE family protein, partial [Bacteroidales bacterium]